MTNKRKQTVMLSDQGPFDCSRSDSLAGIQLGSRRPSEEDRISDRIKRGFERYS